MKDWPKENPIYSAIGLFVHIFILEDKEFDYLLEKQGDKEFYIPSAQLIDEICKLGYEASSQAYKKLETFLMKKLSLPYHNAVTWCTQIWANCYNGESPAEVINKMVDTKVVFDSEKIMNEFLGLLVIAHNNTRMKENRGHKPSEFTVREFIGGNANHCSRKFPCCSDVKRCSTSITGYGISS